MGAGERALHDRGGPGEGVVGGVVGPQHHQQVQGAQLLEGGGVEGAVGRAEEARGGAAEQLDAEHLFEELFVLFVRGEERHHRVGLGVVAHDVPGAQLGEGAGGEVALLLADREEGGVDVEGVQHVHELEGVGAGAVVEGERELVPVVAPFGDGGGVGEDAVDRRFFGAAAAARPAGRGSTARRPRGARLASGVAAGAAAGVRGAEREHEQRHHRSVAGRRRRYRAGARRRRGTLRGRRLTARWGRASRPTL